MPLFEYRCEVCKKVDETIVYGNIEKAVIIYCCGKPMTKLFPLPAKKPAGKEGLSMLDPRYAEIRRKECGVEV